MARCCLLCVCVNKSAGFIYLVKVDCLRLGTINDELFVVVVVVVVVIDARDVRLKERMLEDDDCCCCCC